MQRCPNCGLEAYRTEDWACQWCGYPLTSRNFKKIPKTYQQLQEERRIPQVDEPAEAPGQKPAPDPAGGASTIEVQPGAGPTKVTEKKPLSESPVAKQPVEPAISEPEFEAGVEMIEPEPEPEAEEFAGEVVEPSRIEELKTELEQLAESVPDLVTETPEPAAEMAEEMIEEKVETATGVEEGMGLPAVEEKPVAAEETPVPEAIQLPPPVVPAPAVPGARTVEEIDADYRSNSSAADEANQGKTLIVSGAVERVTVNENHGIYYIILGGTQKTVVWNLRCTFDRKSATELMGLKKGQAVVVKGTYDGYGKNIVLKDCLLVH